MSVYQRIVTPWVHWYWGRGLLANLDYDRHIVSYVRAVQS